MGGYTPSHPAPRHLRALPAGTGATGVAYLGGERPAPRGLGLATATSSATFLPHCEQRIRAASFENVTDLPAIRASASGSMCRDVPHGQVTRTRKSPKQSSSRLMWGRTRTRAWCRRCGGCVHAAAPLQDHCMG